MSYQSQQQLMNNTEYQQRVTACVYEQAMVFKDDGRADIAGLAHGHLKGNLTYAMVIWQAGGAAPGWATKVDKGDGTIDQALVTDGDIQAFVQGNWQVFADLFFNTDGTVKP